ncbi:MAG TPA: endonuclease/exonuclease/phosphatase family protein [Labilithrix sp.]|nr:endonuclease/exonuclease/phosphatase family protein [Labilithrix sp.]
MSCRIATFNLKDFFLPRSDAERSVAPGKLVKIGANLRRANADVVALQEVGEEQQLDRLVKEVADLGYGAPVVGTTDKRGIRCAILSRLPVQWSQVHTQKALPFPRFLEGDAEPFVDRIPLRRGVVHVRVEDPEIGEIDVLTTHFKSNLPVRLRAADGREVEDLTTRARAESALRSLVQRAAEALYIRGLVDDIMKQSPDHAVCVLGDLNDHIDSLPVKILRGHGAPSHDALRAVAELLPAEWRFSCFHGNEKTLIDHILVSDRLFGLATAYEIYNEELRYHGPHVEPIAPTEDSDHALCVATFGT